MGLLKFEDEFEDWRHLRLLYRFAVEEIDTKLKILNEEYNHHNKNNPIEHIKTRVKSRKSITNKLAYRGYEATINNAKRYLNDIAGVRIICAFTSDIYTIMEVLKQQDDLKILEIKDYIKDPKPNGYQSLHMLVEVPVFLAKGSEQMRVEIQIRTIAMDFWASLEHKLRYKYYESAPGYIAEELRECALMIKDLDCRMLSIKEEIDQYGRSIEEKDYV